MNAKQSNKNTTGDIMTKLSSSINAAKIFLLNGTKPSEADINNIAFLRSCNVECYIEAIEDNETEIAHSLLIQASHYATIIDRINDVVSKTYIDDNAKYIMDTLDADYECFLEIETEDEGAYICDDCRKKLERSKEDEISTENKALTHLNSLSLDLALTYANNVLEPLNKGRQEGIFTEEDYDHHFRFTPIKVDENQLTRIARLVVDRQG